MIQGTLASLFRPHYIADMTRYQGTGFGVCRSLLILSLARYVRDIRYMCIYSCAGHLVLLIQEDAARWNFHTAHRASSSQRRGTRACPVVSLKASRLSLFGSLSSLSASGHVHIPVQCMANMYYPLLVLSASCLFPSLVRADVTIYGLFGSTTAAPVQSAGASTSTSATTTFVTTSGPPSYTGLAAYNPVYYQPPAIPSPAPANQFAIGVPSDQNLLPGISIPLPGTFFGFSIEMSVANQLSKFSFSLSMGIGERDGGEGRTGCQACVGGQ